MNTDMTTSPEGTALGDFAAALDACHDRVAPGDLTVSYGGWAVASPTRVTAGAQVPGSSGMLMAQRGGTPAADRRQEEFADELIRLHLQTVRQVLNGAVARLGERVSEGANLLNRQLVQGAVADVALALSESDNLRELPLSTPRRRWRIHRDLVNGGRTALKLYGASGFVAGGPGTVLYLAEVLGNTYLHPQQRGSEAGDD
ncbi:hypothetical protein [Streptomyces halobius]|uniref:Acyl-CoA dehydrogenase-like protein n=1 Tax=Streptomyces halobius TaxID=2879846 RepID=A0ABY4M9Q3_9ACTN|nr:hypothetical protein [Streptomyces halobius]UQA94132.1 hypothetical protein K9S39_21645 [Streptomyces halobius]